MKFRRDSLDIDLLVALEHYTSLVKSKADTSLKLMLKVLLPYYENWPLFYLLASVIKANPGNTVALNLRDGLVRNWRHSVAGHRSNTLDNQCGANITYSSVSGASLPLSKRGGRHTTRDSLVVGKSKIVLNIIKS